MRKITSIVLVLLFLAGNITKAAIGEWTTYLVYGSMHIESLNQKLSLVIRYSGFLMNTLVFMQVTVCTIPPMVLTMVDLLACNQ